MLDTMVLSSLASIPLLLKTMFKGRLSTRIYNVITPYTETHVLTSLSSKVNFSIVRSFPHTYVCGGASKGSPFISVAISAISESLLKDVTFAMDVMFFSLWCSNLMFHT